MEAWELIRGGAPHSWSHCCTDFCCYLVQCYCHFFSGSKLYFSPIWECSQVTWGVYMQGWWITCRKPSSQSWPTQCSLCVPHHHQSSTTRQPYGGMQYNGLSQICHMYELWGAFPHIGWSCLVHSLAASGKINYNYKVVNLRSKGNVWIYGRNIQRQYSPAICQKNIWQLYSELFSLKLHNICQVRTFNIIQYMTVMKYLTVIFIVQLTFIISRCCTNSIYLAPTLWNITKGGSPTILIFEEVIPTRQQLKLTA